MKLQNTHSLIYKSLVGLWLWLTTQKQSLKQKDFIKKFNKSKNILLNKTLKINEYLMSKMLKKDLL